MCAGVEGGCVLVWREGVCWCGGRVCADNSVCACVGALPCSPHPTQVRPLGVPEWGALLDHYYTMAL